jgi:hypothetical protein
MEIYQCIWCGAEMYLQQLKLSPPEEEAPKWAKPKLICPNSDCGDDQFKIFYTTVGKILED